MPQKKIENKIINKAFSEKQVILLRRFNAMYRYQELKTKSKLLNKVHYKYREFLLHIIAFLAGFIPSYFIKNEILISPKDLKKIKLFYQEDWEVIIDLARQRAISKRKRIRQAILKEKV